MDKRYQVFVSSTYTDLVEERQAVILALLQLNAIPAGMELFPAADDDAWSLIRKVIEECDYYLLLIGGRYGSIDSSGISFTEKEYDYAVSLGKPVMAFLHGAPDKIEVGKSERAEATQRKLEQFRDKVKGSKHCKFWTSAGELAGQVALSYSYFLKNYAAIGWVRGDDTDSPETLTELNQLRKRNYELESELQAAQERPPAGAEDLAHGKETYNAALNLNFDIQGVEGLFGYERWTHHVEVTWDNILAIVGTRLLDECTERELRRHLANELFERYESKIKREVRRDIIKFNRLTKDQSTGMRITDITATLEESSFGTVLVQLMALGYIARSKRQRSVKDRETYWTLTPYGEGQVIKLRAIRKKTPLTVARP